MKLLKSGYYRCIPRLITKDEMKRLTRSEDCSELKADSLYLPWTMMQWNFVGEIKEYYIDKSALCSNTENSVSVFFPSKGGCQKNSLKVLKARRKFSYLWIKYKDRKISIIAFFDLQKYSNGKSAC